MKNLTVDLAPSKEKTTTSIVLQLISAAILGSVILFAVGFAPMDIGHNAAHDSRHSHAFPCH